MAKTRCPMCSTYAVPISDERQPFVGEGEICDIHCNFWRDYNPVESYCLNCSCRFVILQGEDRPTGCESCQREQAANELLDLPIGGSC